jgi:hypothetical protein
MAGSLRKRKTKKKSSTGGKKKEEDLPVRRYNGLIIQHTFKLYKLLSQTSSRFSVKPDKKASRRKKAADRHGNTFPGTARTVMLAPSPDMPEPRNRIPIGEK